MKVAMVGPYPEPGRPVSGGIERVIDTLLPALAGRVELTLIVPGASRSGESVSHGVRTVYLERGPGPGVARYWTVDAWRLAQAVERLRPDLVHLQGMAGVGRLVTLPRILTVHGILHRDLLAAARGGRWAALARHGAAQAARMVEARARRRIGNVIVVNPYVLEALPDIGTLGGFAIPNPVDPAFLTPPDTARARERHVLAVGRIGPLKNTLGIVRIAARAMKQDPALTLSLCGEAVDADYHRRCLELIGEEGLQNRIRLPGNLTSAELVRALDRASCLIMASRQENAPMAIAEAHARGVAALAPEAFGIRHMIVPGRNGFFLPDDSVDAQAAMLRRALDHDWDRGGIARRARLAYDPDRVAEMTVAAYRDVLTRSPRDAATATLPGSAPRRNRGRERSGYDPA